ncbi:MAG: hypothetical protein A2284_00185 [Deltaproteobacteria bacterium RIFOXYA12_FULL_61_11]|nr:MAG: hypothetical protein A2284_00185 [Deltaproteobacteria bacterium RIFOXYA12_FULL_61_11]
MPLPCAAILLLLVLGTACGGNSETTPENPTIPPQTSVDPTQDLSATDGSADRPAPFQDFPTLDTSVAEGVLSFHLSGYHMTCSPLTIVVERELDERWEKVNLDLPLETTLVLDDEVLSPGMCDVRTCEPFEQLDVPLREYVSLGSKSYPDETGPLDLPDGFSIEEGSDVPYFQSRELTEPLRIRLNYYADPACEHDRVTTTEYTPQTRP